MNTYYTFTTPVENFTNLLTLENTSGINIFSLSGGIEVDISTIYTSIDMDTEISYNLYVSLNKYVSDISNIPGSKFILIDPCERDASLQLIIGNNTGSPTDIQNNDKREYYNLTPSGDTIPFTVNIGSANNMNIGDNDKWLYYKWSVSEIKAYKESNLLAQDYIELYDISDGPSTINLTGYGEDIVETSLSGHSNSNIVSKIQWLNDLEPSLTKLQIPGTDVSNNCNKSIYDSFDSSYNFISSASINEIKTYINNNWETNNFMGCIQTIPTITSSFIQPAHDVSYAISIDSNGTITQPTWKKHVILKFI
jgi:hypothetical protein